MFQTAEAFKKFFGPQNFIDDPGTLSTYSRDESFVLPIQPWGLVKPRNVNEVQETIRWANQTKTPLVPLSSGPPHFHGGTVPSATGALMVDLSGMKRIIRIDRRNRVAYIEAGVTFAQLLPELAREQLRLNTPLAPRANKSVIASLLEREPGLIPRQQWSALDPLRCVELVWGDGQKFLTGEAGFWPSLEAGWSKKQAAVSSSGPGQTDYYRLVSAAQGSLGIVTWGTVKCEVLSGLHKLFFVPARRLEDLLDFTYQVLKFRFGDELLVLNSASLAALLGGGNERTSALMKELPPWIALVGIEGGSILPEEKVEFQEKDILDIAQKFGLQLVPAVPGAKSGEVLKALHGPSPEPYWKLSYRGSGRDIFFLTTLDKTPEFLRTMYSVAEAQRYPVSDIGVYIQPVHQGVNCHCEFDLPFNPSNPREVALMRELFIRSGEALLKQGAFFSRPYGPWASLTYNRDAQTTMVLKKVKDIFDPNHILNPGKLCF